MSQTRKNVRSTKVKKNIFSGNFLKQDFKEPNKSQLKGRKVKDVYTKVYDVRNTVFQTKLESFPHDHREETSTSWSW